MLVKGGLCGCEEAQTSVYRIQSRPDNGVVLVLAHREDNKPNSFTQALAPRIDGFTHYFESTGEKFEDVYARVQELIKDENTTALSRRH